MTKFNLILDNQILESVFVNTPVSVTKMWGFRGEQSTLHFLLFKTLMIMRVND